MTSVAITAVNNNGMSYQQVISLFDACFYRSFNTLLQGGHAEPLYLPAQKNSPAQLFFREDFVSSALHEIAHWCIAGDERRQKVDFGYWYEPDGRNRKEQLQFERVEVKPQALEWIFSEVAGVRFHISLDNLDAEPYSYQVFAESVKKQAVRYLTHGLPLRAQIFCRALKESTGLCLPTEDSLVIGAK